MRSIAHGRPERAVAVLTHVDGRRRRPRVRAPDQADRRPAHRRPARRRVAEEGLVDGRGPGRGVYRRVVASPGADGGSSRRRRSRTPRRRRLRRDRRRRRRASRWSSDATASGWPWRRSSTRTAPRRCSPPSPGSPLLVLVDRRRRGLRRLPPADQRALHDDHRGRDAGATSPPGEFPAGSHGPEGRVRAALPRRAAGAEVDHHLARTPAGRAGRQGRAPTSRRPP